jgi:hypothetical protein
MTASNNSPRSGSSVTDAQEYDQILRETAESQLDQVSDRLGRHRLPNDLEGIESEVRAARLQLELVEEMIGTRREELNDDE